MSADKMTRDDKLKNLECLFTWDVDKDDINDLKGIPEKLLDRVKYCPRRYHATYFNILAFVSHLQGRNDTALEYLAKSEAVLKEEKQDVADFLVTYSSFAWLHHHLGNMEDMETYLGKVKRVGEGGETAVEAEKGWSFLRMGAKFYQRAKESFQKALDAKPDSVSYNVGYAIVLYRLEELVRKDVKDMPEDSPAARQLQRALDLDPTDAEVMVLLALKLQGFDSSKCRELISKALTVCPDVPHVTRNAGRYFRRDSSIIEALKILEEAVKRAPNSSFLYHQMGQCHWQEVVTMKKSGKWRADSAQVKAAITESIRNFIKTVELKPSNTYAWVHLAIAYAENRQLEDAKAIFTKLLSDDSLSDTERQHCHNKYGSFLRHQMKSNTQAVDQFKMAYRIRIDSRDRQEARENLRQIGIDMAKSWRAREDDGILAFLSEVDQQDRQLTRAATAAESDLNDLNDSFKRKMAISSQLKNTLTGP
ncbi:interferon-induced protein with tetratricopeptide repeats 5-like isoform X1 [Alosa pseudoharengus]|uniref:interferon-induced protein with tetratricopeptide repeats 5-like isoform X1 n=2 Tax=Alosa pseudoharengus TaxID=34774 RepID=UPI003F8B19DE